MSRLGSRVRSRPAQRAGRAPVVLSEAFDADLEPSASLRDLRASTEAARLAGASVHAIPADFEACGDAERALASVPAQATVVDGLWIGYIPNAERYAAIYAAAQRRGIRLANSPSEHERATELDLAYPFLAGLTPASRTFASLAEIEASALVYPVFVKGAVQSRKSRGWRACVARDGDELLELARFLFALASRSRGRVLVRELLTLRHHRTGPGGFPLGREFRVFVWRGEVVGWGYYWEGEDELAATTAPERDQVHGLALEAARRLSIPYLSVDIGQDVNGRWWVIEVGDGQFSGTSQVPRLGLWNRLVLASQSGRLAP